MTKAGHLNLKQMGIVIGSMTIVFAALSVLIGVEIKPPIWKVVVFGLGHPVIGAAAMYYIMLNTCRLIVRKELIKIRSQGCEHHACIKKQKYQLN